MAGRRSGRALSTESEALRAVELELFGGQLEAGEDSKRVGASLRRDGDFEDDRLAPKPKLGPVAGEPNGEGEVFPIKNLAVAGDDPDEIIETCLAVTVGGPTGGAETDGNRDLDRSLGGFLVDVAYTDQLDADDGAFEIDVDEVAARALAELNQLLGIGKDPIVRTLEDKGVGPKKADRIANVFSGLAGGEPAGQHRHGKGPSGASDGPANRVGISAEGVHA